MEARRRLPRKLVSRVVRTRVPHLLLLALSLQKVAEGVHKAPSRLAWLFVLRRCEHLPLQGQTA